MEFPFITRTLGSPLVYNGDPINLEDTIDSNGAYDWYASFSDKEFKEVEISEYGIKHTVKLPIPHDTGSVPDEAEDITEDFHNYIIQLAQRRMLSDVIIGLWTKVLRRYKVYDNEGLIFFHPLPVPDNPDDSHDSHDSHSRSLSQSPDYNAMIMAMKDELCNFKATYKYKIYNPSTDKRIHLPLTQEYDFTSLHPSSSPQSPSPISSLSSFKKEDLIFKNNYTIKLRYLLFHAAALSRQATNNLDEIPPLLYDWQYKVLKAMGHETLVTNIRRGGKTILIALIILSYLLSDNPYIALRPKAIIVVGIQQRNMNSLRDYLFKMMDGLGEYKDEMFNYDKDDNVLFYRECTGKNKQGRRKYKTLSFIKFVGAIDRNPAVGDYCDHLIIDEAHKIPDNIWSLVQPFVENEGATLFAASTIYKGVKKNRFYDMLIKYELKTLSTISEEDQVLIDYASHLDPSSSPSHKKRKVALRFNIEDNHERFTKNEIENLKEKYIKEDPEKYYTELYGRYPDEGKVFDYNKTIAKLLPDSISSSSLSSQPHSSPSNSSPSNSSPSNPSNLTYRMFENICVGYDPALTSDIAGCVVGGYCPERNKLVLLEEHQLNKHDKSSYKNQPPMVDELRKNSIYMYSNDHTNVKSAYFAMDGTQRATADLFEMSGVYPDLRIFYTGSNTPSETKDIYNEIKVSKETLVQTAQAVFNLNKIVIDLGLTKLKLELENFYEIVINGRSKYEGIKSHDDFVNAMLVTIYFLYEKLGLKYKLVRQQSTDNNLDGEGVLTRAMLMEKNDEKYRTIKSQERRQKNNEYFRKFVY